MEDPDVVVSTTNEASEYWALLIAVGVYADNPMEDRPLMFSSSRSLFQKVFGILRGFYSSHSIPTLIVRLHAIGA